MSRSRTSLLTSLSVLLFAGGAFAAEPPLTREQQVELSDLVVTGKVEAVYGHDEKVAKGVDAVHVARLRVEHVEKGEGPRPGSLLHVRYRKTKRRPDGWAGPSGQRSKVAPGLRLRLFLSEGRGGGYDLLAPNGAEAVDAGDEVQIGAGDLDALQEQMSTLVQSLKAGNKRRFAKLVREFRLPSPGSWFRRVFGPEGASGLTKEYATWAPKIAPRFRNVLNKVIASSVGEVGMIVLRAEGYRAIGVQRRASFAMRQQVHLYTIKFPQAGRDMWNFARVGGKFRWVGKLKALPTREPLVVKIRFSSTTIDPARSKQYKLQVIMINESTKVVNEVPTVYDGTTVRLSGRGMNHMWPLALRLNVRPRQVYEPLAPKARRVIFEVSLKDLFKTRPRSNFVWDWGAHPVPPNTPIHKWRAGGYEMAARFVMSVWAGGRTLFSKPVVLGIRPKD